MICSGPCISRTSTSSSGLPVLSVNTPVTVAFEIFAGTGLGTIMASAKGPVLPDSTHLPFR